MAERLELCPNCFSRIGPNQTTCEKCGLRILDYNHRSEALPLFTKLNEQYVVGEVLGRGGFGITYKALDTFKNQIVCIKEYMPSEYAVRSGKSVVPDESNPKAVKIFNHAKKAYIDEIKTLYQFENLPGIVRVITHFQENNTAYLVMEFLDGSNLKSAMRASGGTLSIERTRDYIYSVASSLSNVHQKGVLHRDISPENIYLLNNQKDVKLIDFGAARRIVSEGESHNSVLLKPGFAPPEQYSRTGNQGPWTDVYALAATMYYLVSGTLAPDSMHRMKEDKLAPLNQLVPGVTARMSDAVMKALELDYSRRTQNCIEFLNDLDKAGWTGLGSPISGSGQTVITSTVAPVKQQTNVNQKPQSQISGRVQQAGVRRAERGIMCRIDCISGTNAGQYFEFDPLRVKSVVVGRSPNACDFVPSGDSAISKQHCVISFNIARKTFSVRDVSTNGTILLGSNKRLVKNIEEVVPNSSQIILARNSNVIMLRAYYQER